MGHKFGSYWVPCSYLGGPQIKPFCYFFSFVKWAPPKNNGPNPEFLILEGFTLEQTN